MGRLSWIIPVGTKCNPKCEVETDFTTEGNTIMGIEGQRERFEDTAKILDFKTRKKP